MLALGFVALSAAPSDDPSDPFGDVAARRGRSEGVDVSTDRRSPSCEVIDGGNMSRTSAKGRCQGVEGVSPILMGEMGALFVVGFGVGIPTSQARSYGSLTRQSSVDPKCFPTSSPDPRVTNLQWP